MADMHEAMAEKNVDVMVVTGLDETACEYRNMHVKCMHVSRTKFLFLFVCYSIENLHKIMQSLIQVPNLQLSIGYNSS